MSTWKAGLIGVAVGAVLMGVLGLSSVGYVWSQGRTTAGGLQETIASLETDLATARTDMKALQDDTQLRKADAALCDGERELLDQNFGTSQKRIHDAGVLLEGIDGVAKLQTTLKKFEPKPNLDMGQQSDGIRAWSKALRAQISQP